MFESVKQGDQIHPMMYLASLAVSLAAHAVLLCLLIVVPLVFFNVLQADELISFIYAPPGVPVPPPAPTPPVLSGAARPHTAAWPDIEFREPARIPDHVPPPDDAGQAVDITSISAIPGLTGSTVRSGEGPGAGLLAGIITGALPAVPLPPPPEKKDRTPIRVGDLQQSRLIYRVNPLYPELARRARVSGDVVVEALVDEDGSIATVRVLSGHPLLVNAAIDAVKQWKYSPTVLSGEPVRVLATVTVMFRLNN